MAELSPSASEAFVGRFLDEFNAHHAASFRVTAIEPAVDPSCDYLCADARQPDKVLKIQVTRAVTVIEFLQSEPPDDADPPAGLAMHGWLHNREARARKSYSSDTPADSAARAVSGKARRLGPSASDLVLLIVYDLQRFDDEVDLPEMIEAVARLTVPFQAVWAVWSFQDEPGRARLIWPNSEDARPGT